MVEEKLLGIPKLDNGTGKVMAVHNALQERHVEDSLRAMCFDTIASNTWHLAGTCVILEQLNRKTSAAFRLSSSDS